MIGSQCSLTYQLLDQIRDETSRKRTCAEAMQEK